MWGSLSVVVAPFLIFLDLFSLLSASEEESDSSLETTITPGISIYKLSPIMKMPKLKVFWCSQTWPLKMGIGTYILRAGLAGYHYAPWLSQPAYSSQSHY